MAKPIFGKKNILVIGGAGFIGSHLCDELVRDHKVICLDNFITGSERNIDHLLMNPNFEFVRHDVIDGLPLTPKEEGLEKFKVAWQGVQEIYYFASPTSQHDFQRFPTETLLANSVGLYHALELAQECKAKFLFASSDLVYGEQIDTAGQASDSGDGRDNRVNEQFMGAVDPIGPRSQFIEGKRFGEALVTAYHRHFELDVRIARIFNTYGPRMKLNDTRLIVDFVRRAIKNETLTVYGGAEALGTYCYVSDMVKGMIRLMEQAGQITPVNFGQDTPIKLVELAQQVIECVGSSSKIKTENGWPAGYHRQLIPNISCAKEQLGWFPVVLLKEGLKHTVDYLTAAVDLIEAGGAAPTGSRDGNEEPEVGSK